MPDVKDAQMKFVRSTDDAMELMRWLGERHDFLAFDTETSGLRWWDGKLRLVQFGDLTTGWAVPWDDWAGLVREVFRKYTGLWVGHNVSFDQKWLRQNGVEIPASRCADTMTAYHLIDPRGSQALKDLATRLVDRTAASGQKVLSQAMAKQGWSWATVPVDFPPYWGYGALDTVLTAHLWDKAAPQVTGAARLARAFDLEMAARDVCTRMEMRGARIDLDYCVTKRAELERYADEVVAYCRQVYGVEPTSTKQVAALLQRDGVELTKRTPAGAASVDSEVLESIDHPLAQQVLNVRKSRKIATAYFRNLVELVDVDRVHPSIRTHQALTGRMSVTEPALQTLPRGEVVRNAFLPEEGHKIYCVDYSNVELRLAAAFSEEPAMIEAFLAGRDLHTETARGVFHPGSQDADVTPRERQIAKAVNFTLWYGGGADAVAAQAKITPEEAKQVLDRYYAAFRRVKDFQRETEASGKRAQQIEGYPFVESPRTGRRWPAEDDKAYTLVNYMIQGSAAEEFKRALVRLDQADLAQFAIVPVHDEVVFSIPEEAIKDGVVTEICRAMEVRDTYAVPLEVEASGPYDRWGEKYKAA